MALRGWWAFGVPLSAALGALAPLVGRPPAVEKTLFLMGSLWLFSILAAIFCRHPFSPVATVSVGAVLWAVGNALWVAGYPIYQIVAWWTGFLVLIIAGERLELSRLLRLSLIARAGFFVGHGIFVLGLVASLFAFDAGIGAAGICFL